MKKILALACVAIVCVFAMCACSSDSGTPSGDASQSGSDASAGDSASAESGGGDAAPAADGEEMRITLITMDQMDVHWVKLEAAAKEEVEKLQSEGKNIAYSWLAPEKKDNAQQIQQIETAINNGAQCIIISVNDSTACNDALQSAVDQGIKIVYVDSPADFPAEATFATDNFEAGKTAGEQMLAYLKEAGITSGEIGIVGAQMGSPAGTDRIDGFREVVEAAGYTTSETQYSDGDASKAQELANALINDGCVAMFGANDGSTTGTANAVSEANANGKNIICVGFDNTSSNRELVRTGALLAFMAQNPAVMGVDAIDAAVDLLEGKSVDSTPVDTGATVVTTDNVEEFED